MVHVKYNDELLRTLKDKVIVLTGGATGIGRATVKQFHAAGAKVVFGDVADTPACELASQLGPSVDYIHCDTTSYQSQLSLFKTAESLYGRVDIVVANAGVANHKDIFAPDADIEIEPSMIEIDVNLKGALFTARIGLGFLRRNRESGGDKEDRGGDIILVSSIAGFKECGGLAVYTASKHGVVGLMRGLYLTAREEGVRVNVVCPWMTKTRLVAGIERGWYALGLPVNLPEDVARSIILCATANRSHKPTPDSPQSPQNPQTTHPGAKLPFEGKIVWVAGGESYEIEDAIQALEPQWLGEENSRVLAKGQAYLANGQTSWDAEKGK
ncbi:putative 15-hydroxyprostaglandin dehydrogenase [Delitschia confertaspora ATCC 74209]|uniref:15-hydroxyprostaglandin dehydrogenase n=1 Tax=Delitschia confertaspora ATCC 74209 TaxID=1513339 RepID=A0A9P4JIE8_9PLEO|nr:putative 15-hydroxyprostaglandin dehydrogenase [Delitschia confertaspora ATCC 74209]